MESSAAAATRGFRADIEGLRAVAVLAVVLYHADLRGLGGGWVGVDVFYVLSGFLITGLLWDELCRTGRISFAAFYARRVRRLLPAATLVLVVTVVAAACVLPPLRLHTVAEDAVAVALYAANYRFAAQRTDYLTSDADPSPLQHYWSLGVEEQFYLLWPLLLLVASLAWRRRPPSRGGAGIAVAVAGGASLGFSLWLTSASQPWAFFSLPTRVWELTAGGAVALAGPELRRLPRPGAAALGWAGLVAVAVAVTRFGNSTPYPGIAALLPVGGTAALVAAGCATSPTPRLGPGILLGRRPLRFVGRLSYSWYLWHWPVIVLAPAVTGRALGAGPKLALAAASGLLAALTVRLVEDPVRFAPRLRSRPRWSLAAGAGLTAVAVVVAVGSAVSVPGPSGQAVAAPAVVFAAPAPSRAPRARRAAPSLSRSVLAAAPVLRAVRRAVAAGVPVPRNLDPSLQAAQGDRAQPFTDGCHAGFTGTALRRCAYGDPRGTRTVLLLGDSHATHWFPALDRAARARHWRLVSVTKSTCPPPKISFWSPVLGRPYRECDRWREAVLARIRAERPDVVVMGSARHYNQDYRFQVYGRAWLAGWRETVRAARAAGARVVVLGPTPLPRENVPDCVARHLDDTLACTRPLRDAVDGRGLEAEQAAVQRAGGVYVDVRPWACARGRCAVVVGNLLLYRDDNHLTTSFTAWLAPVMAAVLEDAMTGPRRPAPG